MKIKFPKIRPPLMVPKLENDRDATTGDFLRDAGHQVKVFPKRMQRTAQLVAARFRR